jgi:hypothetical protein
MKRAQFNQKAPACVHPINNPSPLPELPTDETAEEEDTEVSTEKSFQQNLAGAVGIAWSGDFSDASSLYLPGKCKWNRSRMSPLQRSWTGR